MTPSAVYSLVLPLAAAAASLMNPAGIKLWTYLPQLFFLKIAVQEARSINLSDLGTIELYPFFALFAIYLVCLVACRKKLGLQDFQTRLLLALFATTLACARIRLISYTLLIIAFELPYLISNLINLSKKQPGDGENPSVVSREPVTSSQNFLPVFFAPVACLAGTLYVSTMLSHPQLPQPMPGFAPPFQAIEYLKKNPPKSPIFNDARFGDMIIWYVEPPLPVFIDTRFDMYGDDFCAQYALLNNCGPGWEKALSDFGIEWIFLPPDRPLAKALSADRAWQIMFKDDTAEILKKREPASSPGSAKE